MPVDDEEGGFLIMVVLGPDRTLATGAVQGAAAIPISPRCNPAASVDDGS